MAIDKIGLEVEGGWSGKRFVPPLDLPVIEDRSIDGRTFAHDRPMKSTHVGEVVSEPLPCTQEAVNAWLKKYWPTETNSTCGYHIHLSFTKVREYSILTRKSFLFDLIFRLREKAERLALPEKHYIWHRLRGENPFTTVNFDATNQLKIKRKQIADRQRYGMINCAWGLHKTLEFRAFPTFPNSDEAIAFTWEYVDAVEEYLRENATISFSAQARLVDAFGELVVIR